MTERAPVTAMVFTLNEELHLPSCLVSLEWCDQVIVVDSFSTDTTESIARGVGAEFVQHAFKGFGNQRNWALEHVAVRNDWVLILDADERVPPELANELTRIASRKPEDVGAYRVRRRFYMWGRWLKHSGLYPSWLVRFIHKDRVRYVNRGHAETQEVKGEILDLDNDLIDENLKGIDEWFERQNRYSRHEAEYELARTDTEWLSVFSAEPLRRRASLKYLVSKMPFRAFVYFVYSYFFRGGFRDGFVFCRMKSVYQQMIAAKKYDIQRNRNNTE